MKHHITLALTLMALSATVAVAAEDMQASAADGSIVNLHPDGTWTPVETITPQSSGMVNLTITEFEQWGNLCYIEFQYENNTSVYFDRFDAHTIAMVNGYPTGNSCVVRNLRPGGTTTCPVNAREACSDIDIIAVAGTAAAFQGCVAEGQHDSSGTLCDPYLNIVQSPIGVPLLRQ